MCDKCCSDFDLNIKIPYLLPCGHSMCQVCLDTEYSKYNYIRCSEDKNVSYLKKENYPQNYFLIELMEEFETSKQATSKILSINR